MIFQSHIDGRDYWATNLSHGYKYNGKELNKIHGQNTLLPSFLKEKYFFLKFSWKKFGGYKLLSYLCTRNQEMMQGLNRSKKKVR
jgi:hypothetical protein